MSNTPTIDGVDCGLVIMKSCYVSKSELLANLNLFTQVAPKSLSGTRLYVQCILDRNEIWKC